MNKLLEKNIARILFLFSCVALGCMIMMCFNESIWKDEVFVFNLIKHPYSYFLLNNRDAAPPLHFVIVKFAVDIGKKLFPSISSIVIGKLVSVVPFIFLAIFAITRIRKYFGELTAAIFILLITTMPKMLGISIEVRMYSWALLFTTLCFFTFYEMLLEEGSKKSIECAIVGALAAYTHYYACFAIAFFCIFFLCYFILTKNTRNMRKILFVITGASILFSPWLIIAGNQVIDVAKDFWIPPISYKDFLDSFTYGLAADVYDYYIKYFVAFLFYILLFFLIVYNYKKNKDVTLKLFIFAGILTPLFVAIVGICIKAFLWPVYQARYLFPALGCFWLVFSILVSRIKNNRMLFFIILFFILWVSYLNLNKTVKEEMKYKYNLNSFKAFFETLNEEDILITNNYRLDFCLPMYIDNEIYCWKYIEEEDWTLLEKTYQRDGKVYYMDLPQDDATSIEIPDRCREMGYYVIDMGEFGLEYVLPDIYEIQPYK